jgi:adenylate kinase family enzyme
MARVVIIGNASGGKSTLARKLASRRDLPLTEIDQLLWQPGWKLTPPEIYERRHAEIIKQEAWVIEGLGSQGSIPERMARTTEIILIDLPLWVHFWLLLHEPWRVSARATRSARPDHNAAYVRQDKKTVPK